MLKLSWGRRVFSVVVVTASLSAQGPVFTRTVQLSSVRASYHDLSALITKVHSLVVAADASHDAKHSAEWLTVEGGSDRLELTTDFSPAAFSVAPPIAYSVVYSFRNPGAPISEVNLRLHDVLREAEVSGSASDQVEAVSAMLANSLHEFESPWGGLAFRIWSGVVLAVIGLALSTLAQSLAKTRIVRVSVASANFLVWLSLWLFPWERWFPGTAIYSADAAFIVREAPLISFVGAIVTILALAFSLWQASRAVAPRSSFSSSGLPDPSEVPTRRASGGSKKAKL